MWDVFCFYFGTASRKENVLVIILFSQGVFALAGIGEIYPDNNFFKLLVYEYCKVGSPFHESCIADRMSSQLKNPEEGVVLIRKVSD